MPQTIDLKNTHNERRDNTSQIRNWFYYMTMEGSFATIFIVLTGSAFIAGLALMWGANDFEIGLVAAIPYLAQAAQLLSVYVIERIGKRKPVIIWTIAIGRQIWWIVIPMLFLTGEWRIYLLIGLLTFSNVFVMIATPGWLAWMADLVPERIRGRYIGVRSAAISIVTIITTIGGGIILDKFRNANLAHIGFAIIVGVSCIGSLIALLSMKKLPEISAGLDKLHFNWKLIMEPLRNINFRPIMVNYFVWNIAVGTAAAFFMPHMINNLHMNFTQIAIYLSASALIAFLLNKPWGIIIDKFGNKPVLTFCSFGIVAIPLLWLFPRPDFLWLFIFESIYSGVMWTGFSLAIFNFPITNSPRDKRIVYLAMFATVSGMGFFIASLAGGALAEYLSFVHWQIGKQTIVNYHILFALTAVLRLVSAFMTSRLHEPKDKHMPDMIQYMGSSVLKRLSVGRQLFPWTIDKRGREQTEFI